MGIICPKCREWVPDPNAHQCTGVPIPSLRRIDREIMACLWQVNTLTDNESATRNGLEAMNWAARVKRLCEAVGAAAQEMGEGPGASAALKIFVAPEFYFSTAKDHFFDELTKEQIRGALISLSKEFSDILIIPGSVAWYKTSVRPRKSGEHSRGVSPRDFSKYLKRYGRSLVPPVSDFAKYAQDELGPHRKTVAEGFRERLTETESRLKIAHNTIFVLYRGGIWHKYNKRHEAVMEGESLDIPSHADRENIVFPPTDSNPNLPPIDGIRIGLETCVDHEHGSLLSHSGKSNHLHVVASGTVSLMREHAAVMQGGFVLQADAESAGAYQTDNLFSGDFDPYQEDEDNPKRAPRQNYREVKAPMGKLFLSVLRLRMR